MLLRHKMAGQTIALILGLLLISAAGLWGVNGLHHDFRLAARSYAQLRRVYDVASHVTAGRNLLNAEPAQPAKADLEIQAALFALEHPTVAADGSPAMPSDEDRKIDRALRPPLEDFQRALRAAIRGHSADADYAGLTMTLDQVLGRVRALTTEMRKDIDQYQQAGAAKRHTTIVLMVVLSGVILIGGVAVGILQYRGVMKPLGRLAQGVRQIAGGSFSLRLPADGAAEFAALATDFNTMTAQLDELYRELEQKVAAKSKELVRTERLASVGYLAAGVAHEINNPLSIITGHAELLLKQIERTGHADGATAALAQSLRIVCEEAFRCKDITQKLLSLAKPGSDGRSRVSLAKVAGEVVGMLSGLPDCRERRLILTGDGEAATMVEAAEGEMKQVILNLALNALQAVAPATGEVHLEVRRRGDEVVAIVNDNGRGMSAEVLERVFEPFFTDKRGSRQPGTGLGLSITYAIVESHGGRIVAESAGAGQGSRFTVTLPAV